MPPFLIERVAAITSVDDVGQLQLLEEIVKAIEPASLSTAEQDVLFRLFERFPDEDGYGLFFSLLHKLERSPGYETELISSVNRTPTEFNLEMVARIVRSGVAYFGATDLAGLLRSVAQNSSSSSARQYAVRALSGLESSSGA